MTEDEIVHLWEKALGQQIQVVDPELYRYTNAIMELWMSDYKRPRRWQMRVDVLTDRMQGKTLQAIGERLNLSRERIRQIESRGLRILRHPNQSSPIRRWAIIG